MTFSPTLVQRRQSYVMISAYNHGGINHLKLGGQVLHGEPKFALAGVPVEHFGPRGAAGPTPPGSVCGVTFDQLGAGHVAGCHANVRLSQRNRLRHCCFNLQQFIEFI